MSFQDLVINLKSIEKVGKKRRRREEKKKTENKEKPLEISPLSRFVD